jgi:hypothetical protein
MKRALILFISISLFPGTFCATSQDKDESRVKKILKSSAGEPVIPRGANRILIRDFINRSGKEQIENRLVQRIEKLISMDGRLAVVTSIIKTDLVLSGTILSYAIQNFEYDKLGQPVKKRMRITALVNLVDRINRRTVFRKSLVESFTTYSDILPPVEKEFQVVNRVIDELAERIVAKTLTGWYTDKMTDVEKGKR